MLVRDLIDELKKFPELSTVFIDASPGLRRLGDTSEIWVKYTSASAFGDCVEAETDADDYGIVLL
ncbi:hypothetical protein A5742_31450 [Mycolicibacterium fortuitum]|uniref:Uncharacterized protein n=1 Tax=Mycolicibacterium fortuitum TaxID=1766 RepID=A0ABD6QJP3_MYCFO|nr:hypothetical protein A5742_31450 [Mycolicibacterium fortuitum]